MILEKGATANVKRVKKGYIHTYGKYRDYTNSLHEAAKHGHKVVTSLLLEYGASVDEPCEEIRYVKTLS
jgi:ankyrin repeat protein